jgi:hypothetical protein
MPIYMYLVVVRHLGEHVPVFLTEHHREARRFIDEAPDDCDREVQEMLQIDFSPGSYCIYEFKDGLVSARTGYTRPESPTFVKPCEGVETANPLERTEKDKYYLAFLRSAGGDKPIFLTDDRKEAQQVADGNTDGLDEDTKELLVDYPGDGSIWIFEFEAGKVVTAG